GSFTSFRARFRWVPADADPAFDPALSHVLEWNGAVWSKPPMWARTVATAEAAGITTFGDFVVGDALANTYRFNKSSGTWSAAVNRTPTRATIDDDDKLVFDVGGTVTAIGIPNQTIGQLVVTNHTALSLHSSIPTLITMIGGPGVDLQIDAGSSIAYDALQS